MTVLERECNLSEPVEQFILSKVVLAALSIRCLEPLLDLALQVTIVSVVHDDTKLSFFGFVHFTELGDVRMVKDFQDLCFVESFSSLFLTHLSDVDLLDHRKRVVRQALHEVSCAEGAHTEGAHLLVSFECLGWLLSTVCLHHFEVFFRK